MAKERAISLGRLIPEKLKKPFPIKTHSLEEFISTVKDNGGKSAEGSFDKRSSYKYSPLGLPPIISEISEIGDFEWHGVLASKTSQGRKIIFGESYETRFGSDHGFSDMEERNMLSLRCLITLDDRLTKIKEQLPNVSVVIVENNEIMDTKTLESVRIEAAKRNLEPYPSPKETISEAK